MREHAAAIGDLERQLYVLLTSRTAVPCSWSPAARPAVALDDDRSEAEAELIEQQEPWFTRQGAGDREHLLLASGKEANPATPQVVQRREMLKGDGEAQADDTLARVGLAWGAGAMPAELSQGQRNLVGLARALAGRPRLLCLDEPAAGLDTRESEELGRRLRTLANQGQSTLLIDHDMGLVLGICDRVVVFEFGKVIADGSPAAVRANPAVIAAYLGSGRKDRPAGHRVGEIY
jgi:ABC-type dipeptide/oligopeptide/nickel transport system ATPase component